MLTRKVEKYKGIVVEFLIPDRIAAYLKERNIDFNSPEASEFCEQILFEQLEM